MGGWGRGVAGVRGCAGGGWGGGGVQKSISSKPPCMDFFWNSPFHNSPPTV